MAEAVCYWIIEVRESVFAHICLTFRKNLLIFILGVVYFELRQSVINFVNRESFYWLLCMKTGTYITNK